MKRVFLGIAVLGALAVAGVSVAACENAAAEVVQGQGRAAALPKPKPGPGSTANIGPATSQPAGATPVPAQGLAAADFAKGPDQPRWMQILPNGDVLVVETNAPHEAGSGLNGRVMGQVRAGADANRITLLRDTDGDGVAETRSVFLDNLNAPFGMALIGKTLYVANTDAVVAFPYVTGALRITAPGKIIVALPAGPINHHWTRDVIASPDGTRLYVTVGSNSRVGEGRMAAAVNRADVLEITLATHAVSVFASGLRNANGLAWPPEGAL